jgi:hypothetical protein
MTAESDETRSARHSPGEVEPGLPDHLHVLCVGLEEPSWIALTLQLDAHGCREPRFHWVSQPGEALAALRDESFDCILIDGAASADHSSALASLMRVVRASGCDDPMVFAAAKIDDELWTLACEQDCDVFASPNPWESPALAAVMKRAIQRVDLSREKHRLAVRDHRRHVHERDEADHLLSQQRQIADALAAMSRASAPRPFASAAAARSALRKLRDEIDSHYHELLRTYVIMGSGSLGSEIDKLARLIVTAQLSPRETLLLHLERVETLVRGLGNRSTRHILARADLLALELMIHLGERYLRKFQLLWDHHQQCPSASGAVLDD